ncbi:hypothetical protein ACIPL1_02440 [Pseudomonas sp. NPDC090202]|uniref:hypothetical protein n=1 Tax=unclassified Pseudomonas TaxID=196821 RepID=UPI00382818C5
MIEPLSPHSFIGLSRDSQNVVPLGQRLELNPKTSILTDADLDAFCRALQDAEDGFNAHDYLKQYVNAQGEQPFRTTGPQMELLKKIMEKLKEEGKMDSQAYGLANDAFGKAFSMNFMVQEYMRVAMTPPEDEENSPC